MKLGKVAWQHGSSSLTTCSNLEAERWAVVQDGNQGAANDNSPYSTSIEPFKSKGVGLFHSCKHPRIDSARVHSSRE